MTPRKTDTQQRKEQVLGIVIDQYIKTVSPVSSGLIAEQYPLDLSSATIRNILASLEEEGYLTHPHTSAGRVPTQDGYRYYVDNLMDEIQLLEEEKARIKAECAYGVASLEYLLDKASTVISDVTRYTSIVSVDGQEGRLFCKGTGYVVEYPDLQNIQKIQSILHALEKKERLLEILNRDLERKIDIYIGHELALAQMENCSLAVSSYQIENGPSGRIALLGPTHMDYKRVVSTLEYFSKLMGGQLLPLGEMDEFRRAGP